MIERGIVNLHLIGGENFIGRVEEADGYYLIHTPRRPNLIQIDQKHIQAQLTPVLPWTAPNESLRIGKEFVLFVATPAPDMLALYAEATALVRPATIAEMPRRRLQ